MPALPRLRQPCTLLLAAAVPLALAVDDVRVRRQLEHARRDPLTGLPGRDGLTAYATKQLTRRGGPGGLALIVDGNGFKQINDDHGHVAGDQVVIVLAQRLSQWCTARGGLAVRLGGDEFAAVLQLPREHVDRELAGLHDRMNRPVPYADRRLPFSVAIGAAHTRDLPDRPWADLLRAADAAMYRVKRGEAAVPHLGTTSDADAPSVRGRRPGRPGTHLPAAAAAPNSWEAAA